MTRNMAPEGIPGPANAEYYRKRTEGGVGLILTEGTVVDRPGSRNMPNIPFIHGEAALAGWRGVVEEVHKAGGKIGPQIWHTGSTRGSVGWDPGVEVESPSGLVAPDDPRGKAMTEEDVADLVAAFASAAADSRRVGFDMAELHGAHGYLIDQFFWDVMNKRDDKFGGTSLVDRASFASDILKEIRKRVSPDFPIILRYSQWKQQQYDARLATTPEDLEAFLKVFVDGGVDVLHASQRRYWEPEFPEVDGENGLNGAGWAKKLTGLPTITVGSVGLSGDFIKAFQGEGSGTRSLDDLEERLSRGEFDLVAVGRALLQDPAWARKVHEGRLDELNDYDAASLATLS